MHAKCLTKYLFSENEKSGKFDIKLGRDIIVLSKQMILQTYRVM